jgi:hypothetical protein
MNLITLFDESGRSKALVTADCPRERNCSGSCGLVAVSGHHDVYTIIRGGHSTTDRCVFASSDTVHDDRGRGWIKRHDDGFHASTNKPKMFLTVPASGTTSSCSDE